MHPTQPYMYATITSQNSVAIINPNTFAVEGTVFVGSGPTKLVFSPDGSKAYIANSSSDFVAVLDTQTRAVINSFVLPEPPYDLALGSHNRIFVLGESHIYQIDATTGASTGASIGDDPSVSIYYGFIRASPDGNTLYYADEGISPATMYKYDISGNTPVQLIRTPFSTVGYNGEDLIVSHDGNFLCFVCGAGPSGYAITKYRTSDFAALGAYYTGPYPLTMTFSQDDSKVYASVWTGAGIKVFDANTFLSLGTISGPEVATKLAVDSTGRHLFAGYSTYYTDFVGTVVYNTGNASTIDFNHDGKADYLLFNATTRQTIIWYLDHNRFIGGVYGPTLPIGWSLVDVADFDLDGNLDYALFNAARGETAIYYLDGNSRYLRSAYGPHLSSGWSFVAIGDFNRDDYVDFVGVKNSTGETAIGYLNKNDFVSQATGPTLPANWQLVSAVDFDLDHKPDFLLFNSSTRRTALWFMNDVNYISGGFGPILPSGYRLTGIDDFNLDGKPDYILFNPSTRQTAIWYMNGRTVIGGAYGPTIPAGWSLLKP